MTTIPTVLLDFGEPTLRPIQATDSNIDRYMRLADFDGTPEGHDRWLARAEALMEAQ